jgi:hypothetical protein
MANIHERLQNTPYTMHSYATRPSRWTLFWRRCLIKQIFQFFSLNLKIMRIVVGGHS